MAEAHFNELSPAELERLAILMEEAAEVQQVVGKILRHGYESKNPLNDSGTTNRELLEIELGHLVSAIALIYNRNDVRRLIVQESAKLKIDSVRQYLHHQGTPK